MLSPGARGLGHDSAGSARSMATKGLHAALTRLTLVLPHVEPMRPRSVHIHDAGFAFPQGHTHARRLYTRRNDAHSSLVALPAHMGVFKHQRPLCGPQLVGLLLQGHPRKGFSMYRNSRIAAHGNTCCAAWGAKPHALSQGSGTGSAHCNISKNDTR